MSLKATDSGVVCLPLLSVVIFIVSFPTRLKNVNAVITVTILLLKPITEINNHIPRNYRYIKLDKADELQEDHSKLSDTKQKHFKFL